MANIKKSIKRCPHCRSYDIYKRSRRFMSDSCSGRYKRKISQYGEIFKNYKCRVCKHEFDNPLIIEKLEKL